MSVQVHAIWAADPVMSYGHLRTVSPRSDLSQRSSIRTPVRHPGELGVQTQGRVGQKCICPKSVNVEKQSKRKHPVSDPSPPLTLPIPGGRLCGPVSISEEGAPLAAQGPRSSATETRKELSRTSPGDPLLLHITLAASHHVQGLSAPRSGQDLSTHLLAGALSRSSLVHTDV
ncbi:unnamed protein product [Rangifer tarandus platyrhynchus]|uniref:Uncharacterized protein n=1 Tax=Rangifer tarandus platyrhynchus TaxID=3082113 RepID=A0ACB1MJW7_RANTA